MRVIFNMFVFLALVLVLPQTAQADSPNDILVISHKSAPVDQITQEELREIFLKKRTSWKNGDKIIPINAPKGTDIRDRFRKRVLNMFATEEEKYWVDRKIRAAVVKPSSFANTLKAVFKLKRSISYVERSKYREGVVKILLVLPAT